jgi:HD-GYP domain-containing protein (c-di-GMP phosphodiesterase class II)
MSKEQALLAVKKNAGIHFDPALTEIFIKMVESEKEV